MNSYQRTTNLDNFCNSDDEILKDGLIDAKIKKDVVIREVDEGQPCLLCGEKCPGFALHVWRNICQHCKCPRELHDLYHEDFVNIRDRIGWGSPTDAALQVNREKTLNMGYTWVPTGLSKEKVEEYMQQLDNNKIPKVGSDGEKYRDKQLIVQLPKQDLAEQYCRHLKTSAQKQGFDDFCKMRDAEAMDIGYIKDSVRENMVCHQCEGEIEPDEMAIFAPKAGKKLCWHAACFVCKTCRELLVDLCYCHKDDAIYCERHYAESIRPRCAACDELIFSGEYTKAMDQDWHSSHFACFHCDLNLTGHRYILRDEHPYCIKCYENFFAHSCEECKTIIGTDSKDLSYKDAHWHEKCFKCSDCQTSLVDQPFATTNNKLYCADCHDNNFAARCDKCGHVFRAGMKKYEYMGKQWHENCFCCQICRQPIASSSFVPRDQHVICIQCYEQQFAQRCTKCNGVINKGGVTYKGTPWHRDCFICAHCSKSLAGEKFTSHEEKPYCADCYSDQFAKKCHKCRKAITGFGTTKFVSFEDRHWHSDCFQCCRCDTSLVGQGFLTDGDDILCSECSHP